YAQEEDPTGVKTWGDDIDPGDESQSEERPCRDHRPPPLSSREVDSRETGTERTQEVRSADLARHEHYCDPDQCRGRYERPPVGRILEEREKEGGSSCDEQKRPQPVAQPAQPAQLHSQEQQATGYEQHSPTTI